MRHLKDKRRIGTHSSHGKALMRNLVRALIINDKVETTLTRAKALRRMADKMVTLAKKGSVHSRRQAYKIIPSRKIVGKLFDEIAGRYENRKGGYTRIYKLGFRNGDDAPMARIEYLDVVKKTGKKAAAESKGKKEKKVAKETKAKKKEVKSEKKAAKNTKTKKVEKKKAKKSSK